jgi:hypothetical protein
VRKLGFTVGLLLALLLVLVVLDVVAKGFVEARVEDEFRNGGRIEVDEVDFAIDSFPFLGRLGASGEVSATLHLGGIEERGVSVDAFDLEVDGLVFDRVSAFNGDVRVTDLEQATTSISLSEATVADLVGVPVDIAMDGTVTAGGATAQAAMEGRELVLTGEGLGRVPVPIRLSRFLPCDPEVAVADEQVTLTCVTDELPPVVNRVLGEAGAQHRG